MQQASQDLQVFGTVAKWPIFRPHNSSPAQKKCQQLRKFDGLESGLIFFIFNFIQNFNNFQCVDGIYNMELKKFAAQPF
jgi:hypothetical protein